MTLENFYSELGSSYDDVIARLLSEKRINKFVIRFLDDDSFDTLCQSLNNMDYNAAFNSAHNLKGLAQNLGFINLAKSAEKIGNALRSKNKNTQESAHIIIKEVDTEYKSVISAINELKDSK